MKTFIIFGMVLLVASSFSVKELTSSEKGRSELLIRLTTGGVVTNVSSNDTLNRSAAVFAASEIKEAMFLTVSGEEIQRLTGVLVISPPKGDALIYSFDSTRNAGEQVKENLEKNRSLFAPGLIIILDNLKTTEIVDGVPETRSLDPIVFKLK